MIIAHRGVHNNKNIPENSILAFKKALNKDYAIEFDIEITKDEKLIIHHDDSLLRMTGLNKKVCDLTLDEIRKIYLLDTKEKIPTFREVLDLVDGKVFLDIEIKSTKKKDKIIDLILSELENYKGELSLKSFDPGIVNKLKKKTNKYRIGLLVMEDSASKLLNFAVRTRIIYKITNYDFLAVQRKMVNDKYYDKYKPEYIWTFKGLDDVSKYNKKYKLKGYICNDL